MAKISELELLAVADGDEMVPVAKAGRSRRMPLAVLSGKVSEQARTFALAAQDAAAAAGLAEAGSIRNRVDAAVATTRSEEILTAIQLATAGGPVLTGQRIVANDLGLADLAAAPADTPLGTIVVMVRAGLEGVWQLRPGDYAARVAADPFRARYVAMAAHPAAQRAWERVVTGGVFRFSWTGLTADTVDALPMLQSGCRVFDAHSRWELPNHRMALPGNAKPTLMIEKPGVHLHGFGRGSHLDYSGTNVDFFGIVQVAASDVTVSDLHLTSVAPNNSASNPGVIAVTGNRATIDTMSSIPEIARIKIRDVSYARTSTGILLFASTRTDYSTGFRRPSDILIENIEGSGNGAAVSCFGPERFEIRDYAFRYDGSLPSASPVAKKCGMRILGAVDGRIGDGVIDGYSAGLIFDAAYFGVRARNRNMHVYGAIDMPNVDSPISVIECDGELRIDDRVRARRSIATTDANPVVSINARLQLSAVPASEPAANRLSSVGDVVILGALDCEGYAVGVLQAGEMGKLIVKANRVVGNASTNPQTYQRGAVLTTTVGGVPTTVRVNGNDFCMTVDPNLPSMELAASGRIEACDNLLPERDDSGASIVTNGVTVIHTDAIEQRPFNRRVNLGSNRVHPVGAFANFRDGTPMPAATIAPRPWTRTLTGVAETAVGTFRKTVGAVSGFDACVVSQELLTGDCELVYRVEQLSDNLIVGLTAAARGPSFGAIDHGIYYTGAGTASIYQARASQIAQTGGFGTASIERWYRRGSRLIFTRNNVIMLDVAIDPMLPLALQATLARMDDAVTILRFAAL